jgi:hypothetical protein
MLGRIKIVCIYIYIYTSKIPVRCHGCRDSTSALQRALIHCNCLLQLLFPSLFYMLILDLTTYSPYFLSLVDLLNVTNIDFGIVSSIVFFSLHGGRLVLVLHSSSHLYIRRR